MANGLAMVTALQQTTISRITPHTHNSKEFHFKPSSVRLSVRHHHLADKTKAKATVQRVLASALHEDPANFWEDREVYHRNLHFLLFFFSILDPIEEDWLDNYFEEEGILHE